MRSWLVLALALAACGHPAPAPSAPVRNVVAPLAPAPAARSRLTLKQQLARLPKDSNLVIGADFAQLRSSALWPRVQPWLVAQLVGLDEVQQVCGYEPLAQLERVVLAGGRDGGSEDVTMFVRGIVRATVLDCIERFAARPAAPAITVDGDFVEIARDQTDPIRFAFVDDQTVVAVRAGGHNGDRATLAATRDRPERDGLLGSPTFRKMLERVDTRAAVWFLVNGHAGALKGMPVKIDAVVGDLRVGDGLEGRFVLVAPSSQEATSLEGMVSIALDQVRQAGPFAVVADILQVHADGTDVIIDVRADQEQLDRVIAVAAGGLFP